MILIRVVSLPTVSVPITLPGLRDAAAGDVALEVARLACLVVAVARLIRPIATIIVVVTAPHIGHAAAVVALKLVGAAGDVDWNMQQPQVSAQCF